MIFLLYLTIGILFNCLISYKLFKYKRRKHFLNRCIKKEVLSPNKYENLSKKFAYTFWNEKQQFINIFHLFLSIFLIELNS